MVSVCSFTKILLTITLAGFTAGIISPAASINGDQPVQVKGVSDVPVGCMWCQFAITLLHQSISPRLANFTTEEQLIEYLFAECNMLLRNSTSSKLCGNISALVGEELWKFGKADSPRKVCAELNQCPADLKFEKKDVAKMITMIKLQADSFLCDLCQDGVLKLKSFLLNHLSGLESDAILYVCDRLPAETAKACEAAITNDLPNLIKQYITPSLCRLIKLCK